MFAPILLTAITVAASVAAADFSDPEWPCAQRKVVNLSVGQMWAGPPIAEQDLDAWRKDDAIAALAPLLAIRRTGEEEAGRLIAVFAERHDASRERDLPLLFAGAFSLIEQERSAIIAGIGRYARRQIVLSRDIGATQEKLAELNAETEPDLDTIEELEDKLAWDTRIYRDRAQSLTYVCESPVILERRAFALARAIQAHLD